MSRRRRRASGENIGGLVAGALVLAAIGWALQHREQLLLIAAAATALAVVGGIALVLFQRWRRRIWLETHTDLQTILLMHPRRFEDFCRELVIREGFKVKVTRYTSDQGVDLELQGAAGRGIAQVKRWNGSGVGRPHLQQLYGEMAHRGAPFGYFITTSWFTRDAQEWARSKPITLIDGRGLEALASRHFGRIQLTSAEILPPLQQP